MRPLAQVDEAVVLVHADFSVLDFVVAVFVRALLGELFDLVDLVVLFAIAEERERLGHGHVTVLERRVLHGYTGPTPFARRWSVAVPLDRARTIPDSLCRVTRARYPRRRVN